MPRDRRFSEIRTEVIISAVKLYCEGDDEALKRFFKATSTEAIESVIQVCDDLGQAAEEGLGL